MPLKILPDGNLEITVDTSAFSNEERTRLRQLPDLELASALLGNELEDYDRLTGWAWVSPSEAAIGTNYDMIGYITARDEENFATKGRIWWFPQQQTLSPYQVLLNEGQVVFTFGMELK